MSDTLTLNQYTSKSILHMAVINLNVDHVTALLKAEDPNCRDEHGCTALMLAAKSGYDEMVGLLLAANCKIDLVCSYEKSALMYAAEFGHEKALRILLNYGCDMHLVSTLKKNALMYAAESGHTTTMRAILSKKCELEAVESHGATALLLAACNGHTESVKTLIANGCNKEATTALGHTALIYAVFNGHIDVVQTLIAKRCKTLVTDKKNNFALMYAAKNGFTKIVELLLNVPEINKKNIALYQNYALMIAARYGQTETVQLLIDSNCDISAVDQAGRTALDYAVNVDTRKVLICAIAKYEAPSRLLNSPTGFWLAVKAHNIALVSEILATLSTEETKTIINKKCGLFPARTPLFIAAAAGDSAMVCLLRQHGAISKDERKYFLGANVDEMFPHTCDYGNLPQIWHPHEPQLNMDFLESSPYVMNPLAPGSRAITHSFDSANSDALDSASSDDSVNTEDAYFWYNTQTEDNFSTPENNLSTTVNVQSIEGTHNSRTSFNSM